MMFVTSYNKSYKKITATDLGEIPLNSQWVQTKLEKIQYYMVSCMS